MADIHEFQKEALNAALEAGIGKIQAEMAAYTAVAGDGGGMARSPEGRSVEHPVQTLVFEGRSVVQEKRRLEVEILKELHDTFPRLLHALWRLGIDWREHVENMEARAAKCVSDGYGNENLPPPAGCLPDSRCNSSCPAEHAVQLAEVATDLFTLQPSHRDVGCSRDAMATSSLPRTSCPAALAPQQETVAAALGTPRHPHMDAGCSRDAMAAASTPRSNTKRKALGFGWQTATPAAMQAGWPCRD